MSSNDLVSSLGLSDVFSLTFHQSQSVPDHEDPELQYIFFEVPHSGPCFLFRENLSKDGETYLLAMESMDAFAISMAFLAPSKSHAGFKIEIEADGVNVASPCSSGDLGQDYFVISGQVKGQVWVDGVEVRKMMKDKHSRLVRQFVALSPGTGHSLQAQLSIPNSPPSIKINVFAGLEKTMEIYAEIPATGTITLSVYRRTTISELEDEIRSNMHVSLGFFEIIFEGRTLETYRKLTLRDYGIGPYATVSIRPIDRFVGLLGDCAKIRLPYLVIKRGDLEVGPGGLIEQALGEDNGDYEWEIRPMKQLKIRIISPDSYRSITGSDPRSPQPSLERVAKIEPGQRNTENESLEIMSIAEHQDAAPATVAFRDGDQIMLMDYAVKIVRRTSSPENDEDTRSEHSFNNNAVKEDEKLLRGWLQLLVSFCCHWCR